jgi:hypothetical protein
VRIVGLNEVGHESANDLMVDGRDLPWLQNTPAQNVWNSWQVTYRDVIVLDRRNVPVAVFNLTEHDLSDPFDYAELKQILIDASVPPAQEE